VKKSSAKYALQESMELKPVKIKAAFLPRTMGVFILLITALSFAAGEVRREMVLTLTGAVFLSIWSYCLVMTLLLALIHSRRAFTVSIRLSPEKIAAGEWTHVSYSHNKDISFNRKIFQLPLILVRCRVLLSTKDGRRVTYDFKPEQKTGIQGQEIFQVKKRGAYFSAYDEFAVFDILGFFRFAFRLPIEEGARLLVSPHAAYEPFQVRAKGGDWDRRDVPAIERTDDLIDHRPYVPGDDPRRINWKLYSHGSELFIRQGEREPPPHSNITILIDTQFDALYSGRLKDSHGEAVDLLCENALAIINSSENERDIQIGFTGQTETTRQSLTASDLCYLLAYPAASAIDSTERGQMYPRRFHVSKYPLNDDLPKMDLPQVPEDRAILILALPRVNAQTSALERFLSNNANRTIGLIFIYGADKDDAYMERMTAAETCVTLYNRRPGVTARAIGVR
jgi:hypothetical protein